MSAERVELDQTAMPHPKVPHWWLPVRWWSELLGICGVITIALVLGGHLIGPATAVPGDVLVAIPPWSNILRDWRWEDIPELTRSLFKGGFSVR